MMKLKKSNYIMNYDENNLYGWSISQPLPIGNFKRRNEDYYKSGKPCIVEADLEYPKDIQIKTRIYPLMPYNRTISLLLLLSAAPIQGSPQRMFVKHPHRRVGSVLRRMPFLTQPTTDSRKLSQAF